MLPEDIAWYVQADGMPQQCRCTARAAARLPQHTARCAEKRCHACFAAHRRHASRST